MRGAEKPLSFYAHTRTYAHTYIRTHVRECTFSQARVHTYTYAHMHIRMHPPTRIYIYPRAHIKLLKWGGI